MNWWARRNVAKKITHVERIDLEPGDTIIVHMVDKHVVPRQAQAVREQVERLFPEARVLITLGDIKLTHVSGPHYAVANELNQPLSERETP